MTLVSCIVTTCHRPHLVGHAVESVLAQTHRELELIVVVDGPDEATERVLGTCRDPRLRVVVQPTRAGQGRALNTGIALARGEIVALLDDDDTWRPTKLARQLEAAASSGVRFPIVGCRFVARREGGEVVWPTRRPRPGEPVAEYLFCRHQWRFGEGIVPTSVHLAPTALFRAVPLNEARKSHCDLDWLIRADQFDGASVVFPRDEAPLATWEMQSHRPRMSNAHDWRYSLAWIDARRALVGPRAYAGFVLTWVSHSARAEGDGRAFAVLLDAALRHGRPNAMELIVHAGIWALPTGLRAFASGGSTAEPTP
mgnify:CR=1 FL=1